MKAGDFVWYVPAASHALDAGPTGELPFAMGKKMPANQQHEGAWVQALDDAALKSFVGDLQKVPNPRQERDRLVVMDCINPWPAVVHSVNRDGTLNLDVAAKGGATLHYDRVPLDLTKKLHSCHPCHAPDLMTQVHLSRISRRGSHVVLS